MLVSFGAVLTQDLFQAILRFAFYAFPHHHIGLTHEWQQADILHRRRHRRRPTHEPYL